MVWPQSVTVWKCFPLILFSLLILFGKTKWFCSSFFNIQTIVDKINVTSKIFLLPVSMFNYSWLNAWQPSFVKSHKVKFINNEMGVRWLKIYYVRLHFVHDYSCFQYKLSALKLLVKLKIAKYRIDLSWNWKICEMNVQSPSKI